MTELHLWEISTSWFPKPDDEYINSTFTYKSWKEFQDCKPYRHWKPYILSSWSWQTIDLSTQTKPFQVRKDNNKKVYDCSRDLRLNPSSYDIKKPISVSEGPVEMLQIVFISPTRFSGMHRVEMNIQAEDEQDVRDWLKNHMPSFWKL